MHKISELVIPEGIVLQVNNNEKIAVIKELAQVLIDKNIVNNAEDFFSAVLRRENMESTGIGQGVAIPHARTMAVKNLAIVFGRSQSGIDFSSLDGLPSHLIFLIAAPEDKKTEYIITLAKLSKLLRKSEARHALEVAQTKEEVLQAIKNHE